MATRQRPIRKTQSSASNTSSRPSPQSIPPVSSFIKQHIDSNRPRPSIWFYFLRFLAIMGVLSLLFALSLVLYVQRIRASIDPSRLSTNIRDTKLSPDRIALLHMVDDVWFFQELAEVGLRNKRRYARKHQFELIAHTPHETSGLYKPADCSTPGSFKRHGQACYVEDTSFKLDKRAPTFGKIKLALAACEGRDDYWLLWTDADAMVVNQTRSLLDVVDDAYNIMVARDWFMINAGVLLLRCSPWNRAFLQRVYDAREFDKASALDQSALNSFFEKDGEVKKHVKHVPKWLINVYTEEYRAGDFIVHFAGKLYEATPEGITAIARQFDVLSRVEDIEKVKAFFDTPYFLNYFSGTCVMGPPEKDPERQCQPDDKRRLKLPEPLAAFSTPNRYRQLVYRSPGLAGWTDPNDVPGAVDVKIPRIKVAAPNSQ